MLGFNVLECKNNKSRIITITIKSYVKYLEDKNCKDKIKKSLN